MNWLATLGIHVGAVLAKIAGCFAFRAWLRLERSALWMLPGVIGRVSVALLFTRIDAAFAARAYAAYAGASPIARSISAASASASSLK